jgi:hypothetical protein
MQIVSLSNETTVADLASRVYGLKAKDPRLAQASAALIASNPALKGDISKLPAGTPVVVPPIADLSVSTANSINPQREALLITLNQLGRSVKQASAAQLAGVTEGLSHSQTPARATAIQTLNDDLAAFIKFHG